MSQMTAQTALTQPDAPALEGGDTGARGLERRLFIALAGGVLLLTSTISNWLGTHELVHKIPAAIGAVILVIPLLYGAYRELDKGKPSSDSLASLAVIAALVIEAYMVAGFLALFLWMANLILSRTAWGAQRAIRELIGLTPDIARKVTEEGDGKREGTGPASLPAPLRTLAADIRRP